MSTITPISRPLPGERVVALSPGNATEAATDWLRRPNLFPGRALTAPTLEGRQRWQAGRIAQRGQAFTAGTVRGLRGRATRIEPAQAEDGADGALRLVIEPGHGLLRAARTSCCRGGSNCRSPTCRWSRRRTGSSTGEAPRARRRCSATTRCAGEPNPRAIGAIASARRSPCAGARMSRIGVLLLQPVVVDVADVRRRTIPATAAPATTPTTRAAFEDWRIGDGVRLLWYPWPEEWRPLPATVLQLRNALAHGDLRGRGRTAARRACCRGQAWGLPVALVALDAAPSGGWHAVAPAFVDRAARGAPGRAGARGAPAVAASAQSDGDPLQANCRRPPPAGALAGAHRTVRRADRRTRRPGAAAGRACRRRSASCRRAACCRRRALDLAAFRSDFFRPLVTLDAVPVPLEQLDVAIARGRAAGRASTCRHPSGCGCWCR